MSQLALKRLRERFGALVLTLEAAYESGLALVILIAIGAIAGLAFVAFSTKGGSTAVDPKYLESASPCVKSKLRADSDAGRLITRQALSAATNECLALDQARALSQ